MPRSTASAGLYEAIIEAMLDETRAHLRRLEMLSDPEFVEGCRTGLEEQRRGEGVPWEEVLRRVDRG